MKKENMFLKVFCFQLIISDLIYILTGNCLDHVKIAPIILVFLIV